MKPRSRPRRRSRPRARAEIQAVVDETIALFRWLEWVAEQLYGEEGRGVARRWVLRRLQRDGAQTVPALARARGLRRQSLQPVVDALARDGLVALAPNPAHSRSRLVGLRPRGAELVARMDRIDARVLAAVARDIPPAKLAIAVATLRAIRQRFELEPRWRAVLR